MANDTLRSEIIRIAADLPTGDGTRRDLLSAIAGAAPHTDENGDILPEEGERLYEAFVQDLSRGLQRYDWKVTKKDPYAQPYGFMYLSLKHKDGARLEGSVNIGPNRGWNFGVKFSVTSAKLWKDITGYVWEGDHDDGGKLAKYLGERFEQYEPPTNYKGRSMGAFKIQGYGEFLTIQGYLAPQNIPKRVALVKKAAQNLIRSRVVATMANQGNLVDSKGNPINVRDLGVKVTLTDDYSVNQRGSWLTVMEFDVHWKPDLKWLAPKGVRKRTALLERWEAELEQIGFKYSRG